MATVPSPKPNWLKRIALIVVVLVFLLGVVVPGCNYALEKRVRLNFDVLHQKTIVLGLRDFAGDWEGRFPYANHDSTPFTSSTDAYQFYIDETEISSEYIFFVKSRVKRFPPNDNGVLEEKENGLSYITNQNTSMPGASPLTADEMIAPGVFGEHHPFRWTRRAVVGYIDGHVAAEKLSSRKPGATIPGPPGSGIDNLFEPAIYDEEGNWTGGGYLAVPAENILHP